LYPGPRGRVRERLLLAAPRRAQPAVAVRTSPAPATTAHPTRSTAQPDNGEAALWRLFLVFLKVGSVLFGSGYVLVAFLEHDVVATYHWLTSEQLLDAITVGQITPGPVFTTATCPTFGMVT
jgi:chromate transporter